MAAASQSASVMGAWPRVGDVKLELLGQRTRLVPAPPLQGHAKLELFLRRQPAVGVPLAADAVPDATGGITFRSKLVGSVPSLTRPPRQAVPKLLLAAS